MSPEYKERLQDLINDMFASQTQEDMVARSALVAVVAISNDEPQVLVEFDRLAYNFIRNRRSEVVRELVKLGDNL